MRLQKIFWGVIVILAISIGLYPYSYLIFDMSRGLLGSKSEELLSSPYWNFAFYTHIYLGGLVLLIGWTQFVKRLREKKIWLHRTLGKIYILLVLLSGVAGLYISFYATGGVVTKIGFGTLALSWLITTITAYSFIRIKDIEKHQNWMIRSYALTFAAVTLRLWMPILPIAFQLEFIESYRIISWLCWVPNLVFAELLIQRNFFKY
ncbi:MAG: DUF2306 domain-containing protein [Bacteroidetes bacterium]|nr:DUF2306 domain-containing protein [Bacteroidota bacterium]MDA1120298.1 DUF2306 domain-containing protein [Bacteroidota bacterium]